MKDNKIILKKYLTIEHSEAILNYKSLSKKVKSNIELADRFPRSHVCKGDETRTNALYSYFKNL
jgi:hypothetical protein